MGFGMGCCCLQLTFQACNVDEARRVYDALVPIGPILVIFIFICISCRLRNLSFYLQLALSAASPLWRGYIADVDCRWNVIAGSVDDRTPEERGLKVRLFLRFRDYVDRKIAFEKRPICHPEIALRQRRPLSIQRLDQPSRI